MHERVDADARAARHAVGVDHAGAERDGGRFLDQLLVAPLDRALALAEVNDVAVMIAEDLDLDVARVLDVLLEIDVADAERGFRLALRGLERLAQLRRLADDAHAAAAAAGDGLDDDRVAELLGDLQALLFTFDRAVAAGQHGHAGFLHRAPRARLVAHQTDDVRVGADELDVARLTDLREVGALGQEPVAGVNRVGARDLGGADDRGHVEIAVGAARGADADVFVGKPHVQRVLVGLRVDGDRLDAELPARRDDAQGDLAAVGDQDFLEHQAFRMANRRSLNWTGWPFSTYAFSMIPSNSLSISFISFIASMMQSTWPLRTVSPTSTNGFAPGSGVR
jgi:hypothetical protein